MNPQRKPRAGWFTEVDSDLKKEFQKIFPGRSARRKLVEAAMRRALKQYNLSLGYNAPASKSTKS